MLEGVVKIITKETVTSEIITSETQDNSNPQVLFNNAILGITDDDESRKCLAAIESLHYILRASGGFYKPKVGTNKTGTYDDYGDDAEDEYEVNTYEIVKEDESIVQDDILAYIYGEDTDKINDKSNLSFHAYDYMEYQKTTDALPITGNLFSVNDTSTHTVTLKGGFIVPLTISEDKGIQFSLTNGDQREGGIVFDSNNVALSGELLIVSYDIEAEGEGEAPKEDEETKITVLKKYDLATLSATDRTELEQLNLFALKKATI